MKIALYIKDGLEQIVLTPDGETERGIIGKLHDGSRELSIYRGGFYECRGGWVRQSASSDDSTIIVLREKAPPEPEPAPLPDPAAQFRGLP